MANEPDQKQQNDEFPDESSSNASFQLDAMDSYPAELPYSPASADDTPQSSSSDAVSSDTPLADAGLIATLKEDLERSRIQKSKKDSLEDSINKLKQQLHKTDDAVESDEDPVPSDLDSTPAEAEFDSAPVDDIGVEPVMIAPQEEEASVPVTEIQTELPEDSPSEPIVMNESPTPRRKVWPIAAVVAVISLSAGGYWWMASHPVTPPTQTTATTKTEEPKHAVADAHTAENHGPENEATAKPEHENEAAHASPTSAENHAEADKPAVAEHGKTEHSEGKEAPKAPTSHEHAASNSSSAATTHKEPEHASPKTNKHEPSLAHNSAADHKSTAAAHTEQKPKSSEKKEAEKTPAKESPKLAMHTEPEKTKPAQKPSRTEAEETKTAKEKPSAQLQKPKPVEIQKKEKDAKNLTAPSTSSTQTASNSTTATNPDKWEPKLIAKPVMKSAPASSKGLYTVQIYSSPSREDAEEWIKRLKTKNIDGSFVSKQTVRGTTYYRVRFGQFSTREEAEGAALHSGFASGWVDRVK